MTALPAPILPRLGQFVRLLGSDRDGEVVAAARAIGRTLRGVGRDWHDLAEAVEHKPEPRVIYLRAPAEEWCPDTWHGLARWLREHDRGRLTAKEREFVRKMAGTLVMGAEPTERQADWLRGLYRKLGGAS